MPIKPISPASFRTLTGKICSSSHLAAWGAMAFSAKARAASRNANWSSVRLKFIVSLQVLRVLHVLQINLAQVCLFTRDEKRGRKHVPTQTNPPSKQLTQLDREVRLR